MRTLFLSCLVVGCGTASSVSNDAGTGDVVVTTPSGAWVWESDAPSGQLNAIWASSANDAWAGGDDGVMLHWNGTGWSVVDPATKNHVNGVWGTSANDVWAVGGGLGGPNTANLVHWNGQAWSVVDPGTTSNLDSVWGTSTKNVYVAGASGVDGTVMHYDGTSWTLAYNGPDFAPAALGGSSASDVWVAGAPLYPSTANDLMLHGGGQTFAPISMNATQGFSAVWSADASHAWAFGQGGLARWDGTSWSPASSSLSPGQGGFFGLSADAVWAVGNDRQIVAWNGSAWSAEHTGTIGGRLRAIGGAVADASHRWAVGENVVMRFDANLDHAPTCTDVHGSCGDKGCAVGYQSDYACSAPNAPLCCVPQVACGGGAEPLCCNGNDPGPRAICHDGAFYCPAPSTPCPLHP